MWKVDFHTHTCFSPDSLTSPEELVAAARQRGLQRVVVTDHNVLAGALAAHALAPDLVIVGEEIMTSEGEILAAFVKEEVPAGLSPEETIARLQAQDAFISVSHPFDRFRAGHWLPEVLVRILPFVDAIEGYNARIMWPGSNWMARRFAAGQLLPVTAGSDAHAAFEIGQACLVLPPFSDARTLRRSMQSARPQGCWSPYWVHGFSRYAKRQKKRRQDCRSKWRAPQA